MAHCPSTRLLLTGPAAAGRSAATVRQPGNLRASTPPVTLAGAPVPETHPGFLVFPDRPPPSQSSDFVAIRLADRWTVGIDTPFEYEMSERGVVVSHVRPWAIPAETAG